MWLRCQDNEIGGAILGRGKSLRIFPDLALESVWDDYTQEPSKKSDAYHLIVYKNLQYFDQDDWFAMYLYLTEFYHDQMLTGQTGGPDPGFIFEGQRLEPTSENFQLCRDKCLDAYVGQTFDIPTDNSSRLLKFLRKIRRKPIWRKLIS